MKDPLPAFPAAIVMGIQPAEAEDHPPLPPCLTRLHHSATQDMPDSLLKLVRATAGDRVLVVGSFSADLLCASARLGCRSAMGASKPPAHPEAADIVLAPAVTSLDQAIAIASCGRRAIRLGAHGGRLAIRLLGKEATTMALTFAQQLRGLGYAGIRLSRRGRRVVTVLGSYPATAPAA